MFRSRRGAAAVGLDNNRERISVEARPGIDPALRGSDMGIRQIGHGKPVVRLGLTMLLWLILVIVAPSLALATSDKPMTFRLEPNTPAARSLHALLDAGDRTIYADGEITPGTTARFLAFVRTHHLTRARVYLDSPGGSVTDALDREKVKASKGQE